jgi:hypothetical protein
MRIIYLLIISLFSVHSHADPDWSDFPELIVVSKCYIDNNPENGFKSCTQQDCGSLRPHFHTCNSVDCSKTPGSPIQIGNFCQALPPCNPDNYEYGNRGECVICPPPGIYDNDVCNTCPEGQIYSRSEGRCTEILCSEDFEFFMGSCTRKCQSGFIRNSPIIEPGFYPWECVRKPPTCKLDETLINGVCIKKPLECKKGEKLIDNQCVPVDCNNSIVESVNCLKDDVLSSLNNLNDQSILAQIINTLSNISQNLSSLNFGGSDDNQGPDNSNIDTSEFNTDFSINEIEQKTLDQNIFSSSAQCPANRNFSLWAVSYDFSFERICDSLHKLSFLVMAISVLFSVNIILRK